MTPEELERIGDLLIEEGIVTYEEAAVAVQESAGTALGSALAACRFPRRGDLAAWLAADFKPPAIDDLRKVTLTPALASLVPADLARRHKLVPLAKAGGIVCVARPGLHSRAAIQEVRAACASKVKIFAADEAQVMAAIEWVYGNQTAVIPEPVRAATAAPAPAPAAEPAEALPLISMPSGGTDEAPASARPLRIAWAEYEAAERDPGIQLLRVWDLLFVSGKPVAPIRPG